MRFRLLEVSGDRPFMRALLLFLVFAGTAAAFWWHFERRMAHMAPPSTAEVFLTDKDKLLTVEEARALYPWRAAFKDSLGIPVLVQVSPHTVDVPPFAPGTLFVGAAVPTPQASSATPVAKATPPTPQAVVVLPPLARKALGEGPRIEAEEALSACLREERPAPCLEKTLRTLWRQLGGQ